jgi:hypothetical protein
VPDVRSSRAPAREIAASGFFGECLDRRRLAFGAVQISIKISAGEPQLKHVGSPLFSLSFAKSSFSLVLIETESMSMNTDGKQRTKPDPAWLQST